MKTAVLYYSLTGNVRLIAETIARNSGGDLLEVELEKPFKPKGPGKYFRGGRDVLLKRKPAILDPGFDLESYDLVFIGTPVWAGSFVPALDTFFEKNGFTGKEVAFFASSMGGSGKVFKNLEKRVEGNNVVGQIHFVEPLRNPEKESKRAEEWCRDILKRVGESSG